MNNGLTAAGDALLARLARNIQHHPKHVTALVAARQRTRGKTNWDLPWDGSPPGVKAA